MNKTIIELKESPWKSLYIVGGTAALTIVVVVLIEIIITFFPEGNAPQETVSDWFSLFENNWFLGLRNLGKSHSPGTWLGFFLPEIAGIIISVVMLKGKIFSQATAYAGMVGFLFLLAFDIVPSYFLFVCYQLFFQTETCSSLAARLSFYALKFVLWLRTITMQFTRRSSPTAYHARCAGRPARCSR